MERALAELGYWPDARGLRGKPSKLVALIIPDILNVFYTALSQEIEQNLKQHGYVMLLGVTGDSADLYVQLCSPSGIGLWTNGLGEPFPKA